MRKMTMTIAAGAFACSLLAHADAVVDPAAYGFDPLAPAEVNARALQRALDGGKRTVRCAKAGIYEIDRTIFIDSDTVLEFAPGTMLAKSRIFSNVVVNRGAYNYGHDENITVRNLGIVVRSFEDVPGNDSPAKFLRGQLAFYNAAHVRVFGFRCYDLGWRQYCIHIVDFDDVLVEDFEIRGHKDGIHFNCGRNFVVRRGTLATGDDGVAINAGDWPDCAPVIGPIENGLVEKILCLPRPKEEWRMKPGEFGLAIASVWPDWHAGIRLQRNDMVRHGKNVYAVNPMPFSTNEYVSLTAPVHSKGVWKSPEGISFIWLRGDGLNRADVKNIVYRDIDCRHQNALSIWWETGSSWSRAVHPEIPPERYPIIDITLERFHSRHPGTPLIRRGVPAKITMKDCSSAGPLLWLGRPMLTGGRFYPGLERTIVCDGCSFDGPDRSDFIFFGDVLNKIALWNCRGSRKPTIEIIDPAKIDVSGNATPVVVRSPEKTRLYYRMADPWTQLPPDDR